MINNQLYNIKKVKSFKAITFSIVFASLLFIFNKNLHSQDLLHSQFMESGVYLNPALAGINKAARLKIFHREQWLSIPRSYSNTHVLFDWYSPSIDAGLAFSYKHDSQGDGIIQIHNIRAVYSKPVQLTRNLNMNAGIYAAYVRRDINWDKLTFADQLDPIHGFINPTEVPTPLETTIHYPNFGAGAIFIYDSKLLTGFSVNRLFRPDVSHYDHLTDILNIKYSAHLGYDIVLHESSHRDLTLTPSLLYENQGEYNTFTGGFYLNTNPLLFGAWLRHAFENIDAVIFNIALVQDKYKIGYSYDFTVSPLSVRSSGGSHEISITWYFDFFDDLELKRGSMPCPPCYI